MNNAVIELINDIFADFNVGVFGTEGISNVYSERTVTEENGRIVYDYTPAWGKHSKYIRLSMREAGDTVVLSIDAALKSNDNIGVLTTYRPEGAIGFQLYDADGIDEMLASRHYGPWWMYPTFASSFKELDRKNQMLSIRRGEKHFHFLLLCGDNFRCEINNDRLEITPAMSGLTHLSGDFLAVTVGDDPFSAIEKSFRGAASAGALTVPLREDRELPDVFTGLGWCTWDSFRHDVTSAKIYEKLDEMREKKIPLSWVIIDDGWSPVKDMKLLSFDADPEKFPEGLDGCIRRMKEEYGIKYVGVWQAFTGYWMGIEPNGDLHRKYADTLVETPGGLVLPAPDEEKCFAFWDAWHTRLAECGVDFVKVDNQSSYGARCTGLMPSAVAVRRAHRALERSVFKNFGGAVLNCMGMGMEDTLSRPRSALSRNSDDFFPDKEHSFRDHLVQNVYNATWHDLLYYCDFDMWWSDHESARQSGVLRAVSGSPVYVSDKIGRSRPEYILPTIEDDGRAMLCDGAAKPTLDCFYRDCRRDGKLQKIWNRSGDTFVAAVFNISDGRVDGEFRLDTIPGIDMNREYVAYEYFSRSYIRLKYSDEVKLSLDEDEIAVYSIYPIYRDESGEYIMLGNTDKYAPIASHSKVRHAVDRLA